LEHKGSNGLGLFDVHQILTRKAVDPPPDRVILSDGYEAYKKYANTMGLTHAQTLATVSKRG
jgi:hypothetical protein